MTSRFKLEFCAKCKRKFNPLEVRACAYSKKSAMICYWCCKQCPYIRRAGNHWQCGYEKSQEEKT